MSRIRMVLFAAVASACLPAAAGAQDGVVASIKPIHSLVAGVMQGVGAPHLLVAGAASPHNYALRPSDARALEAAKLVFWVGPQMEVALDGALDTLAAGARVVTLAGTPGLTLLPFREGGPFEAHAHGDHDDHGDHAEHASESHQDHGHGGHDMHMWLDPQNAEAMVGAIETALAEADPANAAAYARNAGELRTRLGALSVELSAALASVKERPFIVFHDAYHYFEDRFGLEAAGSITVTPDIMPGAERLREIREKVGELGATCVFSEPQFEPRLVAVATEGTGARTGVLDPLGAALDDGPELYFDLMRGMAASLRECLAVNG